MTRIRLLPIVLFGVTALLCLKLLGLVAGIGSFAIGPSPADASGAAPAEHGEPAAEAAPAPAADFPGPLVDLAAEAEALKKQQESGGHGAAPAGEHGAAPAEGHGEPAETAATDAHGTDLPEEPQAAAGEDLPSEEHTAAPAADDGHGAPADGGEGGHSRPQTIAEGKSDDGHGAPAPKPAYTTVRPAEYAPPPANSEVLVLESLAARRQQLDQRETELAMREKLIEAAETKLQARIDELKALETQLGGAPAEKAAEDDEKIKGLVSLYETMKPKAAARVFDDLDMSVLIAVSRVMSPRKLAPVMAAMDTEKAALLTTALAGSQAPREVVVRRTDGDDPSTGDGQGAEGPQDLPKIMPASPQPPPS